MKINELTSFPQAYTATVRVVLQGSVVNARTTVTADTLHQARLILVRLFGKGNLLSISQVRHDSPKTAQFQAGVANGGGTLRGKLLRQEIDLVQASCVAEAGATTRVLSPQELQVKSLADKADGLKQQAKMMKARQKMAKAQQALLSAQH
jgi:hypothetical protein